MIKLSRRVRYNKFYHAGNTPGNLVYIHNGIWFLLALSVFNCLQTTYTQVSVVSHKIAKTRLSNNDNVCEKLFSKKNNNGRVH